MNWFLDNLLFYLFDLELETFFGIDWAQVGNTTDLLVARTQQLEQRDEILQEAHKKLMDTRKTSTDYWNKKKKNRGPLEQGELVLVYNKSLDSQFGKLFENRWNGPYKIKSKNPGVSYTLEELDDVEFSRRYAAVHFKKYYSRN
jgi:hypothetical protein